MNRWLASTAVLVLLSGVGCGRRRASSAKPAPVFQRVGPMVEKRPQPRIAAVGGGRVLITAGALPQDGTDDDPSASTELFDPGSRAFYALPPMVTPRVRHGLVALPDGDALVVGGWSQGKALDSVERYRSREGVFERLPLRLPSPLMDVQVVWLSAQRLAVVGRPKEELPCQDVVVLDLALGQARWACRLLLPRWGAFTFTRLDDKRALIAGGESKPGTTTAQAEVVEPFAGKSLQGPSLNTSRTRHGALALPDGRVLVLGGETRDGVKAECLASAEVYDPKPNRFLPAGTMDQPRTAPAAAVLTDGKVLVVGGWNPRGPVESPEFYQPKEHRFSLAPPLNMPKADQAVAALPETGALVVSGNLTIAERLE